MGDAAHVKAMADTKTTAGAMTEARARTATENGGWGGEGQAAAGKSRPGRATVERQTGAGKGQAGAAT